ncbi:MAG: Gfo/Idh/MocA family protein [Chloroflexota bacterium]
MTLSMSRGDPLIEMPVGPALPADRTRGIAVVGAGAIVNAAHLPAYQSVGLNVVGLYDIRREKAETTARQFGIQRVYDSLGELLEDPTLSVVDVAVDPAAQPDIVFETLNAGVNVLCQKPLSEDLDVARTMVAAAAKSGMKAAVNQQLRWDPLVQALTGLLREGVFGTVTGASFDIDIFTDWASWPWMEARDHLDYFFHTIHYFDVMRHLFGEPRSVSAINGRHPKQTARGETRSWTIFEYHPEFHVSVSVNHNNRTPFARAILRIEGTEGSAQGILGLLYDYPRGRPDTLELWCPLKYPETTFSRPFTTRWIPDAFVGPMSDLMRSIEENRQPATSLGDNLRTLGLIHDAYRSVDSGRRVPVSDMRAS